MGALSEYEKGVMRKAGFLPFEIKTFDDAKAVDGTPQDLNFKAENFQGMIRSRVRWIALLKSKGWDSFQISLRIKMLYAGHRSKRDSFMLLQAENSPSARTRITDNAEFRRRLVRTRITKTLGASYGKDFRKATLPRHIPKPPETPRLIKDE